MVLPLKLHAYVMQNYISYMLRYLCFRSYSAGDPPREEAPGPGVPGPPPETVLRGQGWTESGQDRPQGVQVPPPVCSLSEYISPTVPER